MTRYREEKELIKISEYLNTKGFDLLLDWPALDRNPYTPYRIKFPSEKILDEKEIFYDFDVLKEMGFSAMNIIFARAFYNICDKLGMDESSFSRISFISDEDEQFCYKKYKENPFFS
ncbi:hypothetical protein M0R19_06880 [Candidatus Pacearchaeota archaeon]|nr:hypothetical protein [Candidatus Pacearchaeota archaeon]